MIFSGNSQILGVGSFIPSHSIKSSELLDDLHTDSRFGIESTWMDKALGIVSRRFCDETIRPSDIAVLAAIEALQDSGADPTQLSAIIYCGITGDFIEPGTAMVIQDKLGAVSATCHDVRNACHGFCDGLQWANLMLGAGAELVLVVTAELTRVARKVMPILERELDVDTFMYSLGMLTVGDAAGAMVLGRKEKPDQGLCSLNTFADGKFSDLCSYDIIDGEFQGGMVMDKISKVTIRRCARELPVTLEALGWAGEKVDHFVMHQVGQMPYKAMLKIMEKEMNQTPANTPKTYPYLGNVTTSTLPINVDLLKKGGKIKAGDRCLMLGTGSGITGTYAGWMM